MGKCLLRVATAIVVLALGEPPARAQAKVPLEAKIVSPVERLELLARAQVWQSPAVAISQARFDGPDLHRKSIACKFEITDLSGTSRKFDCTLEDGRRLRVKYGTSPEIPSEVASARLLRALGFGADHVTFAERLRCYGCPSDPFVVMKAVDLTRTDELYKKFVDYRDFTDFEWVAVERRHNGRAIASKDLKGWGFFELDHIDRAKGGAPRAHVDALRLLAALIAHWDNKSENQRLVCLSDQDWSGDRRCRRPFAMLQDIGAAFGPRKVDFQGWQRAAIWKDRGRCVATMEYLPYSGSTFKAVAISEAGRRHLAGLLEQLSDRQVLELFTGARFDHRRSVVFDADVHPAADWARVFKAKVRQISDGPACPQ